METKLSSTKTENYSCEKIRKLDFDILITIILLHGFEALFWAKNKVFVTRFS